MSIHDRNIQRAIDVASMSEYRWQLGCVITKGGNILGLATNKYRNRPDIDHLNATRHAEMAALARCYLAVQEVALSM